MLQSSDLRTLLISNVDILSMHLSQCHFKPSAIQRFLKSRGIMVTTSYLILHLVDATISANTKLLVANGNATVKYNLKVPCKLPTSSCILNKLYIKLSGI